VRRPDGRLAGRDVAQTAGGWRRRSLARVATLILLRHGRTTSNTGGTLAGRQPTELDEAGRAQAVAVGQRLAAAKVPLAAVVTSPLLRCTQTLRLALPDAVPEAEPRLVEA